MKELLKEFIKWSDPMSTAILKEYIEDGEHYYTVALRMGLDEEYDTLTEEEKKILEEVDQKIASYFTEELFRLYGKSYDEAMIHKWWDKRNRKND